MKTNLDTKGWEQKIRKVIRNYFVLPDYVLHESNNKPTIDNISDDIIKIFSSQLSELTEEIGKMNVTTRTWGKFFEGTGFDNNKKSSIDVKCAYTNGYNRALDDVLSYLKGGER